jgi:hypothetical protein
MAVVRWNPTMPWRPFQQPWSPFEGLESLRNDMDRLFDFFAGSTQPSVAYLGPADKYCGPLLYRLSRVNQPVIRTRNGFSKPRTALLACL